MRVVVFGTAAFAVPTLEALAKHHAVVLCVTQPDRPQGRGLSLGPSPVKRAALSLGLSLLQPEQVRREHCAAYAFDIGVVAAYGQLLAKDLVELPPRGMVGVHPSLLPKYRGAAPVAWAILHGDTETGVSIFRLTERLDAGDVIAQRHVAIDAGEDVEALTNRLACLGAEELLRALQAIEAGRVTRTPQVETEASLAPKLTKEQGRIDWRLPAEAIERLVRGTVPWPGAVTTCAGSPLRIWTVSVMASRPAGGSTQPTPGTILEVGADGFVVQTGRGSVLVRDVQPSGKRRMTVREFLAGHRVTPGERLG